jgi:predicted RNA-binding Zn-ribbon protein involved in translation (DUF1610 family)
VPYPEDPFALRIPTAYICPTQGCGKRLMRETKDQSSPYMGQLKCDTCGYAGPVTPYRAPKAKSG